MCGLVRLEEKLERRSGRQKIPGLQLKQHKLSVEVWVEWRCGVVLGHGKRGLIPYRVVTITDENGNPAC